MSYEAARRRLREQQATTPAGRGLPLFDGLTLEAEDVPRLSGQLNTVYRVLQDGGWHTLPELAAKAGGSEAGVSARIRDLRKPRFGGHTVEHRKRDGSNLWEYRLTQGEHE